jgi:hypothetical protein
MLGVLMLGVRWTLKLFGDLMECEPLGPAVNVALGISIVNVSRLCMGKCLNEALPMPVGGESPVDDGDMLRLFSRDG